MWGTSSDRRERPIDCTDPKPTHKCPKSERTHVQFDVSTSEHIEIQDVSNRVSETLPAEYSGTCTVFVRHTTAGLVVSEAESRLLSDVASFLADVVPEDGWDHDAIDNNAASHLRALLLGPDVTVPVSNGSLELGTWQSVLLVECDGPRTRTVEVAT